MALEELKLPVHRWVLLALIAAFLIGHGERVWAQSVPQSVVVELGEHGGAITLMLTSEGRYTWRGEPFVGGSTVVATNGNEYRLTLRDGEWSAMFVPPPPAAVALGMSGLAVLVTRAENRQYHANGTPIGPDGLFEASNGNTYTLTLTADGWMSEFIAMTVQVPLGSHGGVLTLRQEEDGKFWLGDEVIESGKVITGSNHGWYRVTLADGHWYAEYLPRGVWVSFGPSAGGLVLVRQEDGTYTNGGQVVTNGSEVTGSDGSRYTLAMRDGVWEANLSTGTGVPPDRPDPGIGRRTDTLSAYEGSQPELVADEYGTPRSVLRVGGSEFSVSQLYSRGGVTQSSTFRDMTRGEIEKLLDQMKLLVRIAEVGDDDLEAAIEDKWDRSAQALEALFGREAGAVLGGFPQDDGEMDYAAAVLVLEDVIAALSSLRAFERAVDDGVFRNSTRVGRGNAEDVYRALSSFTRVQFGWTANTRFGSYVRRERDEDVFDDLIVLGGDDGMGVFAYSPLATARTADLPRTGEATYLGKTLAISGGDDPDFYSGTIELLARFTTRRVSALITDLEREDGAGWRYLLTEVESINLPNAYLGGTRSAASFRTSGDASIVFPLVPGGPTVRSLESDFAGRFLGRGSDAGEAVIGTWNVQDPRGNALLTGAFGAEHRVTTRRPRPQIDDDGLLSRTFFGAEPDEIGNIVLGGDDAVGTRFGASQLYFRGGGLSTGDRLFTVVRSEIAKELSLLDVIIELDNDTLRRSLWDRVNEVLNTRVFGGDAMDPLGADYPTTRRRDPDDAEAETVLREVRAALASVTNFTTALEEDGVFHSVREAAVDPATMYAALDHELTVKYGHTDYTRFGAWKKLLGTAASESMTVDTENPPDVFAYSPLAQTVYEDLDPSYPSGFLASYTGRTLAVDAGGQDPAIYQGTIDLAVEWGPNVVNSVVNTVILGLRTTDTGEMFQHQGADVEAIFFSDVRMRAGFNEALGFEDTRPSVRIRYEDIRLGENTWNGNASQEGKFVGKSLDGPLAVIGTWTLSDSFLDIDLKGAYGADLTP